MGVGRSAGGVGAALGGASARNRPRYRALQIPPPQRLPAGERRHAGLSARGAAAAGGIGRRPSPPAVRRVARGFAAAVGSAGGVSDRAAAPGGTAASRPQPATAAGGPLERQRPHPDNGSAAALDERTSAHARRSAAGTAVFERRGLSSQHRPGLGNRLAGLKPAPVGAFF